MFKKKYKMIILALAMFHNDEFSGGMILPNSLKTLMN